MAPNNSPVQSRLFVQEQLGDPLVYLGCVGVRGLQVFPRGQEQVRSVDETGLVTESVPRYPNQQPFDVSFGKAFRKWMSLHQSMGHGCLPNFFLASSYCEDQTRITDPSYFDDAVWLYRVNASSAYQVYNNTAIQLDPNQAVKREDQISFIFDEAAFIAAMQHSEFSIVAAVQSIKSLAVVDEGKCGDFICRPCDAEGGLSILINVGSDFMYTTDGGSNWTNINTSGAGIAQSFNGNAFMVIADAIKISSDVSAALASWTSASTDVSFAGLSNIAQIDARTLVVGGTQGAVWRSNDGGANWGQVRSASASQPDIVQMAYNPTLKKLVAVAKSTTDITIQISSDRGKTWTDLTPNPVTAEAYGANTAPMITCAGGNIFVALNGNLYKVICGSTGSRSAVEAITLVGVSGDITGMIVPDPKNPNHILLTTGSALAAGKVWRTIDGFNTLTQEVLPYTPSTDSAIVNPMAVLVEKYGNSVLMAFGNHIYKARDWESFFVD